MTAAALPSQLAAMDPRISWLIQEIDRRLGEPLDVSQLAGALNLSPSRFAHLFRAQTGVSPMRYVRKRRLERARELLESTFLSVKTIMTQVGCTDPSHFARDFRRHHGAGPREWRSAHAHAEETRIVS
jgi:AraC family transcriptional regulator, arabinose operon regulatory protein